MQIKHTNHLVIDDLDLDNDYSFQATEIEDGVNTSPVIPTSESSQPDERQLNIYELVIKAELPGFDANKIDISVDEGIVTITAGYSTEDPSKRIKDNTTGLRQAIFRRQLKLPHGVNTERSKATYQGGILTITMPIKCEEQAPALIPIEAKKVQISHSPTHN